MKLDRTNELIHTLMEKGIIRAAALDRTITIDAKAYLDTIAIAFDLDTSGPYHLEIQKAVYEEKIKLLSQQSGPTSSKE